MRLGKKERAQAKLDAAMRLAAKARAVGAIPVRDKGLISSEARIPTSWERMEQPVSRKPRIAWGFDGRRNRSRKGKRIIEG